MNPVYPTFTYLSLGAGVQSTALLLMSDKGLLGCPRANVAVFADTKAEPRYVYEHLEAIRPLVSIPIVTVTAGDLAADSVGGTFIRLPAFTAGQEKIVMVTEKKCSCVVDDDEAYEDGMVVDVNCPLCHGEGVVAVDPTSKTIVTGGGMVRRQCTREYKIAPIQKWVREHLGYAKGQRVKHKVVCLVGISVDEIQRAKPSQEKWVTRLHSLIDADMRRRDCIKLLETHGWPVPKKSSCVFCPYHDDAIWRDLRDNHPEDFARAVQFDKDIRVSTKAGISAPVFIHRSLKPLGEVEFKPAHTTPLFDSFTEECEGMCGV